MSGGRRADHVERKALLATRAEFDRARLTLAVHEVKAVVSPRTDADRVGSARPLAAMLVGLLGPFALELVEGEVHEASKNGARVGGG